MLFHKHLIVRTEVMNPPSSTEDVISWLSKLVPAVGMKILDGPYSKYVDVPGNRGATGVVIIETSHMAIHVWDEVSPALVQFDLYTCGELDTSIVFAALDEFSPVKMSWKYLDRENDLIEEDCGSTVSTSQ